MISIQNKKKTKERKFLSPLSHVESDKIQPPQRLIILSDL